jgi:hypothetical protein
MKLTFLKPWQDLQPYIKSMWVFESAFGMPQTDTSLAAPNGSPKLILLYENSLESVVEGRVQVSGPGLYFVGNRDVSALIRSSPQRTGFIGIEFSPQGGFPVFGIPMQETANHLFESDVVFGHWGRHVWERLRNLEGVSQKLRFIQGELVTLLEKNRRGRSSHSFLCPKFGTSRGPIVDQRVGTKNRLYAALSRDFIQAVRRFSS